MATNNGKTVNLGCCPAAAGGDHSASPAGFSRRAFLGRACGVAACPGLATCSSDSPEAPASASPPPRRPLRVLPVFVNVTRSRAERKSWRYSAELYDEAEASRECARIASELAELKRLSDFPVEFLPLRRVQDRQQAAALAHEGWDAMILYPASRTPELLEALARPGKWNLVFLRHRSGRIYYMYIGLHGHYLRKRRDRISEAALELDDVVVDETGELLWRLRALAGLKNTLGRRVLCVGTPGGWGADGRMAPEIARQRFKLDIEVLSYEELGKRIKSALAEPAFVERCRKAAAAYLSKRTVKLETPRESVERSFLLAEVFRRSLSEARADAFTIAGCMGTVMEVSGTTACLPLSLLNDEGYVALCEGDFHTVPAGLLVHDISGKPVFLANPSFPHGGEMFFSHCTAPSRMIKQLSAPVRLLTHYESDFGVAPKVELPRGTMLTAINPDFAGECWLGFRGRVTGTPFYPTCRTQLEVAFEGATTKLASNIRGWHWIICEGDHLREVAYAVTKAGLQWIWI